jgi:hypothetical protein
VHPAWRAWCASFRFEDRFGFDGLDHIPDSGTLLHYGGVTMASMRALVETGVPVDATDRRGFTALYLAVQDRQEHMAYALLESGSNAGKLVLNAYGWTVLHLAAVSRTGAELLTRLLPSGCGLIDQQDEDGSPATFVSNSHTLPLLLEYGADMSIKDTDGSDFMAHLRFLEDIDSDEEEFEGMQAIWVTEKHRRSPPQPSTCHTGSLEARKAPQ